jgi:UDP-2,3-diacylglucosamine pyrophosphatase LpxH
VAKEDGIETDSTVINFEEKVRIIPIGDIHFGSVSCHERKAYAMRDWCLNNENVYVVGMGDYLEGISKNDPRFSHKSIAPQYREDLDSILNTQRDRVIDFFKPLADEGRLLFLLEGNHEEKVREKYGYDIYGDICESLDVKRMGYSCFYRITLKPSHTGVVRPLIIWAHHGYGGGKKMGASVNSLQDAMSLFEADIFLMGHNHKKHGNRFIKAYCTKRGKSNISHRVIIAARTGTFSKTYVQGSTTYAEKAGYPPVDLGVVKITARIRGEGHKLDLHVSE